MSKLIVVNLKSNKNFRSFTQWMDDLSSMFVRKFSKKKFASNYEITIAPPYPFLISAQKQIVQKKLPFTLAVQDLSQMPAGAYTGAICAHNLDGLAVKYAILGHSERRRYFKENNQMVAAKVEQALENDLTPIVCVDEEYIDTQAQAIKEEYLKKCWVAYEPLSAIGSGNNFDVAKVKEVVAKIKLAFGEVSVMYGGSVDEFNVAEYMMVSDGALVGTVALKATSFMGLVAKVGDESLEIKS